MCIYILELFEVQGAPVHLYVRSISCARCAYEAYYYYICVLILYVCPHTTTSELFEVRP
jgi:hypothetical protein